METTPQTPVAKPTVVTKPTVVAKAPEVKPRPISPEAQRLIYQAKIMIAVRALFDALNGANSDEVELIHRVINEAFTQARRAASIPDLKASWDPFAPLPTI